MNLIDRIQELRKLEAKATLSKWARGQRETTCIAGNDGNGTVVLRRAGCVPMSADVNLICGLRNAAPMLLDILGEIRTGDAEVFATLIDYLESNHGGTEYEELELSVMRRYQAMAERMEANHE